MATNGNVSGTAPGGTDYTPALSLAEQRHAGAQLLLAMLAGGLLALSLIWSALVPGAADLAGAVAGVASLLVAIPVMVSAWRSLRTPSLHGMTDRLIALAMLAAWAVGDLVTAAVLPTVMIFGHILEERSLLGSREAIRALTRLSATTARRLREDGTVEEIDNAALKAGDHVEVRAGDRIPADGIVVDGTSSIDSAVLTGESMWADVAPGDMVLGSSINIEARLQVRITHTGQASTLGQVIRLIRSAERAKPPITRLMERYAERYTLFVLAIAAITWFVSGNGQNMLAVIVAACPCALVLAAPGPAIAGIAVAARHGILIRDPAFLEKLANLTSLVIDKTGTLTYGRLSLVESVLAEGVDAAHATPLAARLARASSHPVSRCLAEFDKDNADVLPGVREDKGYGLLAETPIGRAALGRPELFEKLGIVTTPLPAHDGPVTGFALGSRFLCWFLFDDQLRPETRAALEDLAREGLDRQILLTGDRSVVAARIAAQTGILHVHAQALPQQKLDVVVGEIATGFRPMVVGDGINDALALRAGAVGVALGEGGTHIAIAAADIVLISGDLRRLGTCVRIGRKCRATIQANVALALGWTAVLTVCAAAGVLGAGGAVIAAVLHNFGTLLVLANAGRLLRFHEAPDATH